MGVDSVLDPDKKSRNPWRIDGGEMGGKGRNPDLRDKDKAQDGWDGSRTSTYEETELKVYCGTELWASYRSERSGDGSGWVDNFRGCRKL